MKRIFFFCLLCLGFSSAAFAMPGMSGGTGAGNDRFAAADGDKDGFLSREEFSAAFPALKKEAFAIIDTDKDGRVSREEWQAFSGGHGKNMDQGSGNQNTDGRAGAEGGGLPLLPIPRQDRGATPAPHMPPEGAQSAPSLPLLTPPGK